MRVTIDLPPDLLQTIKLRAIHEKRKLKDIVATLITVGLTAETTKQPNKGKLTLPLFKCAKNAPARYENIETVLKIEQSITLQEDLKHLDVLI